MSLLFFLCNCDTFSEKGTDYYEAPWKEIVRRGEGFVLASLVSACRWKLRHVVFWDKSSFSAYRASSDMTTLVVILYYLSVAAPIFYIKPLQIWPRLPPSSKGLCMLCRPSRHRHLWNQHKIYMNCSMTLTFINSTSICIYCWKKRQLRPHRPCGHKVSAKGDYVVRARVNSFAASWVYHLIVGSVTKLPGYPGIWGKSPG